MRNNLNLMLALMLAASSFSPQLLAQEEGDSGDQTTATDTADTKPDAGTQEAGDNKGGSEPECD